MTPPTKSQVPLSLILKRVKLAFEDAMNFVLLTQVVLPSSLFPQVALATYMTQQIQEQQQQPLQVIKQV